MNYKNNIQLVLFFSEKTIYDPAKFSSSLVDKFNNIGSPVILPYTVGAPVDENQPIIMFSQNTEFQLIANFTIISITVFENKDLKIKEIISSVFDIFKKMDIHISRIGYISNKILNEKNIKDFKTEKFKSEDVIKSDEFQLAWFNKIKINNVNANYWKKYITDTKISDKLIASYDINTLKEEANQIDATFVTKFIETAENIIKE